MRGCQIDWGTSDGPASARGAHRHELLSAVARSSHHGRSGVRHKIAAAWMQERQGPPIAAVRHLHLGPSERLAAIDQMPACRPELERRACPTIDERAKEQPADEARTRAV